MRMLSRLANTHTAGLAPSATKAQHLSFAIGSSYSFRCGTFLLIIFFQWSLPKWSYHNGFLCAFHNRFQLLLFLLRHFKSTQRLLKVVHKGLPLFFGYHEM